jgi:hypothetical protein
VARGICLAGVAIAAVLVGFAFGGLGLENDTLLVLLLWPLWAGMIVGGAIITFRWRGGWGYPFGRPELAPWQTALLLALLAFGVLNAFVALSSLHTDGNAAKKDGRYVFQAQNGVIVREITQSEYDREMNQEAHLFFGIALAGWSGLTLFAFMARSRYTE